MGHPKTVALTDEVFRHRRSARVAWPAVGAVVTINMLGEKVPYKVESVHKRVVYEHFHRRTIGTVICSLIEGYANTPSEPPS